MLSFIGKLKPETLNIEQILLDPNNPRFLGKVFTDKKAFRPISENRFHEELVQQKALERMTDPEFNVNEVRESILKNGFLPLDQIVVARYNYKEGYYVVVEGNRRISAIKLLLKQYDEGELGVGSDELASIRQLHVLVLNSPTDQIENDQWLLQGIRHLTGIKEWGPYQKAKLIERMIDTQENSSSDVSKSLGMTVREVNRYYKTLKAIHQMEEFEDYSSFAKPELFTHFEEANKKKGIREWLGWDEKEKKYTNEENLVEFYSWITQSPDGGEAKLKRGKDVAYLDKIVTNDEALRMMCDPSKDLHKVLSSIEEDNDYVWKPTVTNATKKIQGIPWSELEQLTAEDHELLVNLQRIIEKVLSKIESN